VSSQCDDAEDKALLLEQAAQLFGEDGKSDTRFKLLIEAAKCSAPGPAEERWTVARNEVLDDLRLRSQCTQAMLGLYCTRASWPAAVALCADEEQRVDAKVCGVGGWVGWVGWVSGRGGWMCGSTIALSVLHPHSARTEPAALGLHACCATATTGGCGGC
jgi:hypothetical protein